MSMHEGDFSVSDTEDQDVGYWRRRYVEVKTLLDETRAELDDFQISSSELEHELEKELEVNSKEKQGLSDQIRRLEDDRESWKVQRICLPRNDPLTGFVRRVNTLPRMRSPTACSMNCMRLVRRTSPSNLRLSNSN